MLHDQEQRNLATDPSLSFIVEAPAGSGKTEILTQRFLRLLPHVESPEQIIALTFTRKAAHEMRERVLLALEQAATGHIPTSAHQAMTIHYAQQALAQDQRLHWQLINTGNRLRIMTIDALCQMLTQAIPLHSHHYANIAEQPQILYYQAARSYIQSASQIVTQQTDLKILLQHLDNRQDLLVGLFANMLADRDQWLSPLFLAKHQSKQDFEEALTWIEQHELARFGLTLPLYLQQELLELIQTLLTYCRFDHVQFQILENCQNFSDMTREHVFALAKLLLTSHQTVRKSFDHHIGFKRDRCSDAVRYNEIKAASQQLCETLTSHTEFIEALIDVSQLPKPEFSKQQWTVLQALFRVLPLLVAHLELQFQQHESLDFTGVAHQAKLALGHVDTPSDLALYLDHRIQHLLIDEFQDTSLQQFELLSHLVHGWERTDGRTLFVVGDPMQSIYRFRAAEVGLFLRAKTQGIGPVLLQPLQLCANFRSSATIVEWVNQQFTTIFPSNDDIETGAVSFHSAIAMLSQLNNSGVQASQFADAQTEAEGVLQIVRTELQTHSASTIAILVRSRNQLRKIITVLRGAQIPFQGVDIDLLAQLPHIRDIWSVTQAFLMPANRLAWIAFLRSPWGGLSLADLLQIARYSKSIYQALAEHQQIPHLSPAGRIRTQYLYHVFQSAYIHRQQLPLVDTLLQILDQLHKDVILTPIEQEDLNQYWTLLRQFTVNEQIIDLDLFQEQFNRLYSQQSVSARLQIMTIHKSKGLEFDCVILPGLGAPTQPPTRDLMRWLKLPRDGQEDLFLLSPMQAAIDEECQVYQYLQRLDAQKAYYESQRLLYVAVTRTKQRLYLLDHYAPIRKKSFRHMLSTQPFVEIQAQPTALDSNDLPILLRLPIDFYQHPPPLANQSAHHTPDRSLLASPLPRLIGIVTHSMLQWICTYHPKNYADIPWLLAKQHLQKMGLTKSDREEALVQIQSHIQAFYQDPRGQWIASYRPDEHNEYALLTPHTSATRIIDRTFTEHQTRWIIDFKTGQHHPDSQKQHTLQLEQYAELFQSTTSLPIRCGLYYLNNLQWIEWESMVCKTSCT